MSFANIRAKSAVCGALAAATLVLAQPATAATVTTTEIIRTTGPELVDSTSRTYEEAGKWYEETLKKYRTTTVTRTTTKTSRTEEEHNTAYYNYDTEARFSVTGTKWYNSYLSVDSTMSRGTRQVEWGKGWSGPSSYTWAPKDRTGQRAGSVISLGRFTHDNNQITGGITDANLDMNLTLDLGGYNYRDFNFSFDIKHIETWNWGKNVADVVTFSDERFTRTFRVGATEYTLKLLGFHDDYGYYNQDLEVSEGDWKGLNLLAHLTSKTYKTVWDQSSFTTSKDTYSYQTMVMEIPAEVPLPAALPMMLAGLGALGLTRRRRR